MSFIKEFKQFAIQGNLVDLAIAVVMGTAFGKVVSAFIDGMVMPAIGMLSGGVNFNDKKIVLQKATEAIVATDGTKVEATKEVAIMWGTFVTICIEFIIVMLVVFIFIKAMNKLKKAKAEEAAAGPSSTDSLLMEIRDA